jgi:hypothetical protein
MEGLGWRSSCCLEKKVGAAKNCTYSKKPIANLIRVQYISTDFFSAGRLTAEVILIEIGNRD